MYVLGYGYEVPCEFGNNSLGGSSLKTIFLNFLYFYCTLTIQAVMGNPANSVILKKSMYNRATEDIDFIMYYDWNLFVFTPITKLKEKLKMQIKIVIILK